MINNKKNTQTLPKIKKVKTNKGKTAYKLVVKPSDHTREIYIRQSQNQEEIRKLYEEIIQKTPLTKKQLTQYKKNKTNTKEPSIEKYIIQIQNKDHNTYRIQRKGISYGTYKTLGQAQQIKKLLTQNNWDTRLVEELVTRRNKNKQDRYIIKTRENKYYIRRRIGNEHIIFDSGINTIEEAREARDWWENNNWNFDSVDLI